MISEEKSEECKERLMELAKKFQKDGKRVNELKQVYITCACQILRNMEQL